MTMECINNYQDLEQADPETVKFHSSFKGVPHMLISLINKLPFWNVNEEEYAKHLTGNAKVIYEVIKEWESFDTRDHRKTMMKKPLLTALFVYFFDSDFREVINFILWRIYQRYDDLFFPPQHLDPGTWNTNEGGRCFSGIGVPADQVVRQNKALIVLKGVLNPRMYWLRVDDVYYAINSNRPVYVGDGWAYQLVCKWGNEDEFKRYACLGDHYEK